MHEGEWLALRFEENRPRLRAMAYRMLGSYSEADDAVQEAWLRLQRTGGDGLDNLSGWLTTVVGRVCLDMLRALAARREDLVEDHPCDILAEGTDPEQEALLADSVGLALLVVLDTLDPAERLAFVLHDMFAVPFDDIAPIVERTPAAARQLASRARRRVRGTAPTPDRLLQQQVVGAFLCAARGGGFGALVAVLAQDAARTARTARGAVPAGRRAAGDAVPAGAARAARAARADQPSGRRRRGEPRPVETPVSGEARG